MHYAWRVLFVVNGVGYSAMSESQLLESDREQTARVDTRTILVLSADLGGGHDALAKGLKHEFSVSESKVEVIVENGLRLASAQFNELARESYRTTVEKTPWSYQLWFWILSATALARIVRWAAWRALQKKILARINEVNPDVVVSTYPFMTAVLGKMRRENSLNVPAVGLLIDSGPHDLWIAPGIDEHIVMNPADCDRARESYPPQRYYPPLHISSARPAVDPRCFESHNRNATREAFNLPIDQPVLLVSGGSWGLALRDDDLNALIENTSIFVAVACGHNEALADTIEATLPVDRAIAIRFTTEMPALLAACDAALLNAGGMTCYECFALGTPVLLYEPLAGHGLNASRALDEDVLARFVRTRKDLVKVVQEIGVTDSEGQRRAVNAKKLSEQRTLAEAVTAVELHDIPEGEAVSTTAGRLIAKYIGMIIVVATIVGLGVALFTQREAIREFDWSMDPASLIIAVFLFAIGPVTQAVAFWTLLRLVGVKAVRLPQALAVWSWSALARYAPTGVASFVVRVRSIDTLRSTRTQVLTASLYEQLMVPIGGAIFSVLAFAIAGSKIPSVVAVVAIVGVLAMVAMRPKFLGGKLQAMINRNEERLPAVPRGRGLILITVLNIAGWVATGSAAAVAMGALAHDRPDVIWVAGAYSFAWLVGYITPLSPGGVGVREGVLTTILAPHYGVGVAVSIALGMRIIHTMGDLIASAGIEVAYRTGNALQKDEDRESSILSYVRQLRGLMRSGIE